MFEFINYKFVILSINIDHLVRERKEENIMSYFISIIFEMLFIYLYSV